MKKNIINLKKICSIVTASSFLLSVLSNVSFASVPVNTIQSQKNIFDIKDTENMNTLFSDKYGKIISFNNYSSDTIVLNIQDLHCDYSIQKNISSLIDEISNKYNVEEVYVEGGIGKIDTSLLSSINPKYKKIILENLLKEGKLTGTEYYSITKNKKDLLKGLEDKDTYLQNIVRLSNIIKAKKTTSIAISKIEEEIEFLKEKYLNSKNKLFSKLLEKKNKGNITQEKFLKVLLSYAKENNINLNNYKNLQSYLNIYDKKFINENNLKKELIKITKEIKESVSYSQYQQFIKRTSNLTDIKNLRECITSYCAIQNINLEKKYPNLSKFFEIKEIISKNNPLEIIKEERKLVDTIRTILSKSESEIEVAYICDFESFYKGYLTASLTSSQWEYVKLGIDRFKELYGKYSIENDVEKLDKYSKELNLFYDTNILRNEMFVKNMALEKVGKIVEQKGISDVLAKAKKIKILVAGGYHTDGINEILNQKNITNITITPAITKSTQKSRINYEYLAQRQAMSIRQMIALGLITNATQKEQILAIVNSLLSNNNLDGVNIDILVEQINQIFEQNIKFSLTQDKQQIEFLFTDGRKEFVDINEDITKIIEEQQKTDLTSKPLVKVEGEKLKEITELVLNTTFNFGQEIFAPQIYKISKKVCLFMVENKWYLGNGAIWEIANSKYSGKKLDGIEPVIYEYMPNDMQKALLNKQRNIDSKKTKLFNKKIATDIISIILVLSMLFSLTSCSRVDDKTSPYSEKQITEYVEDSIENIELFEDPAYNNRYLSYYTEAMSKEDKLDWHPYKPAGMTDDEILEQHSEQYDYIATLRNTYDQALVCVTYLKMGNKDKARDVLREINTFYKFDNKIYKSNKEYSEILGEIVWVGIAAVQYKIATGSTEFDELIAAVDEYLVDRQCSYGDFLFSSEAKSFNNGAYVSTEHMFDVVAYLNLKSLLPDNPNKETEKELMLKVSRFIRNYLIKDNSIIKRGKDDNSTALDTYSWGIQVLLALQKYNPDVFEESGLSSLNLSTIISKAESLMHLTDEQLKENLSSENASEVLGYHLYSWSNISLYDEVTNKYGACGDIDLVDPQLNVSFEWSLQMAEAYFLMGETDLAEEILDSVTEYSKKLGFDDGLYPASNLNYVYNYPNYGWLVARAPSLSATSTGIMLEYGIMNGSPELASPFFPVEKQAQQPSSILTTTLTGLNNFIQNNIYSMNLALFFIVSNETLGSLFNPLSFIKKHEKDKGAKILTSVTTISALVFFATLFILNAPIFIAIMDTIVGTLFVNIATHAIIDFRYLKSIGIEEAIALYGNKNVSLNSQGLDIKNADKRVSVYVINDKPKNVKEFNMKSVPIKVKAENGKFVKCWIGNYNGVPIIFAKGAKYDTIVKEFSKTKQFESVFGKDISLKANIEVVEIDMNNPEANIKYSEKGNIIVGANIVKTGDFIDIEKEVALLNNKKVEAVTINQNIAVYIDDEVETIGSSQDFMNVIELYVKNSNLGTNAKILFSDNYIDRVLELLEKETGSKDLAQQKFIDMIKNLKDENKEIVVIFDKENKEYSKYQKYGVFSYIANNEYVDGITLTKTQAKFVTNLNQINVFDGSLSIIKVSAFRKEIEETSGIFTFLTNSVNLKEYLKNRSINFIKQVATNFDYNQIPTIAIDEIAKISKSENKFKDLSKYLKETDSIYMYYLGLSSEEEKSAFVETIIERILVVNYLRDIDKTDTYYGLKNKNLENILAISLIAKYDRDGNFDIDSQITMNENLTASQFEIEFNNIISQKVMTGFKDISVSKEVADPQSIDDIIKLIPLYAERNVELRTANVKVADLQSIKGILSAA